MQQPRAPRIGAPSLPSCQKRKAQPEAGFENPPLRLACPCFGQSAAGQEDVPGLRRGTAFGVIDVAKARALGNAVGTPVDGLGHARGDAGAQFVGGT